MEDKLENDISEISLNKEDKKCAPGLSFENGSCIKLEILIELSKSYNKENSKQIKLNSNLETLNPNKYKKYLLKELKKNIKGCKSQKCWTEQSFMNNLTKKTKNELKKYTFRPDGPNGRFEWLNTYNIDNVMNQYENTHQDFKYLGTVPMDFDSLDQLDIKNIDFKNLEKDNKKKIGIVFNLDESWKNGSHWVSLYSDLEKGNIYYFDSYGTKPEKRVRKLMRRIAKYCESKGLKLDADYNKVRHQYKNSECGVYSINFILRNLNGEKFDEISKNKVSDDKINECRKEYFSNVNF